MKDSYRNPFDGINASQLNDRAILEYWCNSFSYNLFSDLKEDDIYTGQLNTLIVGGRSSGKTMLLRYCSFNVQYQKAISENPEENIINYFKEKGGLCFYKRIDGSALNDFNCKNLTEEKKNGLFTHYFEMNICYEYLEAINKLLKGNHLTVDNRFYSDLSGLFGNSDLKTLDDCLTYLDKEIQKVDDYRSKIPFYENLDFNPPKIFAATTLTYNVPEIISNSIKEFEKINFVLLIDEYENFAAPQQRMVNTLLKFTKPNIKFRISMRPEGFNTYQTVSDSDAIEDGREFKMIFLDNVVLKNKDYDKFIIDVCKKRLENVKVFRDTYKTDIVSFLGLRENLEKEAKELTKKRPGTHFNYKKYKGYEKEDLDTLKYPDNPLLEMLNLLWLSRKRIPIRDIKKAMDDYLKGVKNQNSQKYKRDYVDKYKLSLMFLLASVYRKNKKYYSFRTFSFLSFGMVGHFLELCNEAFKYAAFEDKDLLIREGKISIESQNKAAYEVASYQLRKTSLIPYFGNFIYQFVNNIGNIFQYFHLDSKIRYPETNQFSVDYLLIKEENYKEAFRHAIRWSAIQKKKSKQRPSPSKNKADIYTINRIFSPVLGITYRTRGGYSYEMAPDEIVKFMTEKIEPNKEVTQKGKKKNLKSINKQVSHVQQNIPF